MSPHVSQLVGRSDVIISNFSFNAPIGAFVLNGLIVILGGHQAEGGRTCREGTNTLTTRAEHDDRWVTLNLC